MVNFQRCLPIGDWYPSGTRFSLKHTCMCRDICVVEFITTSSNAEFTSQRNDNFLAGVRVSNVVSPRRHFGHSPPADNFFMVTQRVLAEQVGPFLLNSLLSVPLHSTRAWCADGRATVDGRTASPLDASGLQQPSSRTDRHWAERLPDVRPATRRTLGGPREGEGATVAERLDCSPPTKANRVQSPAESIPDFRDKGTVPDDFAGSRVFSGISRFLCSCIPVLLHPHLFSISSAPKSLTRTQLSTPTTPPAHTYNTTRCYLARYAPGAPLLCDLSPRQRVNASEDGGKTRVSLCGIQGHLPPTTTEERPRAVECSRALELLRTQNQACAAAYVEKPVNFSNPGLMSGKSYTGVASSLNPSSPDLINHLECGNS
ncbi:hypothetical protein PR048_007577 [Dryococelus australis]|uniref:Uncharacterized protein n=1 Tax=Dryococelus australis TaxID=614101 RepID=A0ABQ9HUM2_9NEOP|nr:hypothetical protein PR048_007577 [Dryococelus australis]